MGASFIDSGRYASVHERPDGPRDGRPTAEQIVKDNDLLVKLSDKTMLVTGGSSGLGVDIVRQLARTGATVFFTSRDLERGEKVRQSLLSEAEGRGEKAKIEMLHLDLVSLDSVRNAAEDFKRRSKRLHVLVNNAGMIKYPL